MSHPPNLYQLTKTEWRPFLSNRNESWLALSQRDRSTVIYGYKVSNVNSKSKISVFLLAFFLLYIIWIPLSVSKILYFSRIIPNQITENIDTYTEIVWHLTKRRPRMNVQKERKRGEFDSFGKLHLFWEHY